MKPSPNDPKREAVNTVRISAIELMKLEQEMAAKTGQGSPKRGFLRWSFPKQAVLVEVTQPSGTTSQLRYACRNLSTTGMGILHSAFVHAGTKVLVHLPDLEDNIHLTPAKVVRCSHYRGVIHEVGIRFDRPINIRDFLRLDPMGGAFTMEHVNPEKLNGSVLHVDDSSMDRRLVRHHLRDTNLNVVNAETVEQALARSNEGFDMIICEHDLPDGPGTKLIEALRGKGVQTPIILTTSDASIIVKQQSDESARASAYLIKPFSQDQVLRALGEFMLTESVDSDSGGSVYSGLKETDPAYSFVPEFVEELRQTVQKLNAAVEKKDLQTLRRIAVQVRSAAKGLGFQVVGAAADTAANTLNNPENEREWMRSVRMLIGLCLRVRVRESSRRAG
jgi:CheY-like chemotaxis protein